MKALMNYFTMLNAPEELYDYDESTFEVEIVYPAIYQN